MKAIMLDIYGDFARFRRYYTTSSALSYLFPPPPTVRGMIGAIMGLDVNVYIPFLQDFYVGIRMLQMPRKMMTGFNQRTMQKGKYVPINNSYITQTAVELLLDVRYRIYVLSDNTGKLDELHKLLDDHAMHYPLYLGTAECLANYEYIGMFNADTPDVEVDRISTVFPVSIVKSIDYTGTKIFKEGALPCIANDDGYTLVYEDTIYTIAKAINGRFLCNSNTGRVFKVEDEYVYGWKG